MQPRPNHAQKEVGSVIFQRSAEDLLVNRNGTSTLDTAESVDCGSYTQFTNTLNIDRDFGFCGGSLWISLGRNLCKSDANSTNITAKDITTIESFPRPNCIIQTLKIDCSEANLEGRSMHEQTEQTH